MNDAEWIQSCFRKVRRNHIINVLDIMNTPTNLYHLLEHIWQRGGESFYSSVYLPNRLCSHQFLSHNKDIEYGETKLVIGGFDECYD